jgi:hypothetical protein
MGVDLHPAALVEDDAGILQPEALGVGLAARGDQHDVGLETVSASPPFTGSKVTKHPCPFLDAGHLGADSLNSMPCFFSIRWNFLETSPSMPPGSCR